CSFRIPTICSSVNRLVRMTSPCGQLAPEDSHDPWTSFRGARHRPHIPTLRKHSETYPGEALQRWVGAEYETSIDVNEEVLVLKARWVGAAIAALYAEGLLLAIAAVLVLLL
ncbi:MAG: hypothetical protein ACRDJH_24080, partial [Thermomicrobiales bacterium]